MKYGATTACRGCIGTMNTDGIKLRGEGHTEECRARFMKQIQANEPRRFTMHQTRMHQRQNQEALDAEENTQDVDMSNDDVDMQEQEEEEENHRARDMVMQISRKNTAQLIAPYEKIVKLESSYSAKSAQIICRMH